MPTSTVSTPTAEPTTPAPPATDAGSPAPDAAEPEAGLTKCPERTAKAADVMCTADYRPVCGLVDTGVRCITTPCPSAELKTFGNACNACREEKVIGYRDGACPGTEE